MAGVYLVDAMALAYRSFFALLSARLRGPSGEPTSAVYGFAQALLRVAETREPGHFAVVRDLKGPTFRHEMYPAYKAQRQPMPDDLVAQLPLLEELVAACGLPLLDREGFEADDVMASMTRKAVREGLRVYLMTRDKDLMQLVGEQVRLYDPGRGSERPEEIDADWVFGKLAVRPDQVRDYLALVGDASDNVPGVAKVGPKTAAELLAQFGDFDSVYAHLEEIPRKAVRGYLQAGRESALLSRTLVSLRDDLETPPLEDLAYRGLNLDGIEAFLEAHGIHALQPQIRKLRGGGVLSPVVAVPPLAPQAIGEAMDLFATPAAAPALPATNLQTVLDEDDLDALVQQLRESRHAALWPLFSEAGLCGLAVAVAPGIARYLPVTEAFRSSLEDRLWPVLSEHPGLVLFQAKSLRRRFSAEGLELPGRVDDAALAAYLLAPGERNNTLENLARRLGTVLPEASDVLGSGKARRDAAALSPEEATSFAGGRAEALLRVWISLEGRLRKEALWELYESLELPLARVLGRMENSGIALDDALFGELSAELKQDLSKLEARAWELAGREFNLASPKQLGTILFEELALPHGRRTATGGWSTDSDVLEELSESHELPKVLLDYRELAKLLGTYVDVLPGLCDELGRVHTTFEQTVAATGRLSSLDPNLQNIPVRGELGRRIRRGFVASPGDLLLSADYSQIELRLLAHLSGDEALCEVYRHGEDIHTRTAALVNGVAPEAVTADQRRAAKVVNFGVVYGMGAHALAGQLGVPHAQAQRFIDGYFAAYPGVKPWMERVLEEARQTGFVQTILGRKRWVPGLTDRNRTFRESSERMAANTPVQGSAADLIKKAMLAVDTWLSESGSRARLLLQVHDELVLEAPEEEAEAVAREVKVRMESAMELAVPLVAEVGVAKNWGDAH